MLAAAEALDFERAAELRDRLARLYAGNARHPPPAPEGAGAREAPGTRPAGGARGPAAGSERRGRRRSAR
jgi:hypothetical protein